LAGEPVQHLLGGFKDRQAGALSEFQSPCQLCPGQIFLADFVVDHPQMILNEYVVGRPFRGGFERLNGPLILAPFVKDPAICVLKGGLFGRSQALCALVQREGWPKPRSRSLFRGGSRSPADNDPRPLWSLPDRHARPRAGDWPAGWWYPLS